ncbi:MAG: ribonuclease Z, partial [Deltaproteobacteria bacterium]|nr:ribonuclease Z [Deltaproteobacteria bacterium]
MRPSFHPRLINEPFSDPGLFIPFLFEKRALMFDLGDLSPLSSRDLLKVTHVFVTHTHMDHFIGFDTLLRILLGRDKTLFLFGPPNFFKHMEGKLSGYTWNLVNEFQNDFMLEVSEVHPDRILTKNYICQDRFQARKPVSSRPFTGTLLEEPSFTVQGVLLDHRTPCLALSLIENFYVNIDRDALKNMKLPVGPWLNKLKSAIYEKRDPASDFLVTWEEKGEGVQEKKFNLGDLAKKVTRISPGQRIVYITDVSANPENSRKIIELAKGADLLFVEAAFLDSEKEIARRKYHLTAKEAGEIAKKAGVRQFRLFHFSPRYKHQAQDLEEEA